MQTESPPPARIIVAEDEYFVAITIEDTLADAGHDVLGVFSNAEEAIEAATSLRPDLVLMDIRLAGSMTGIEAALELRRLGMTCIFTSAHSDTAIRQLGEQAEPAAWVTKPFRQEELLTAVEDALVRIRRRRN